MDNGPPRCIAAGLPTDGPEAVSDKPVEQLHPEQEAAVTAAGPVTAVAVGPGTGKTETLAARIAWLVEEQGVRPDEITAVTFTSQAALEMRRRG